MFRLGRYFENPKFPARLGYEAAGTIEAIGDGVQGLKIGDAVSTIPAFHQNDYGVYGDTATVPARAVAKHPPSLSWVDAAAVWMQYGTAYGALIDIADLKSGDALLIPAASSSVGIASIQIAQSCRRHANRADAHEQQAKDTARSALRTSSPPKNRTSRRSEKVDRRKGRTSGFRSRRRPNRRQAHRAMADHGILFLYGNLSGEPTPLPLFEVMGKMLTIRGYILFEITLMTSASNAPRNSSSMGWRRANSSRSSQRLFHSSKSSRRTAIWSLMSRLVRSS